MGCNTCRLGDEEIELQSAELVCEDCAQALCVQCERCEQWIWQADEYLTPAQVIVCPKCFDAAEDDEAFETLVEADL